MVLVFGCWSCLLGVIVVGCDCCCLGVVIALLAYEFGCCIVNSVVDCVLN